MNETFLQNKIIKSIETWRTNWFLLKKMWLTIIFSIIKKPWGKKRYIYIHVVMFMLKSGLFMTLSILISSYNNKFVCLFKRSWKRLRDMLFPICIYHYRKSLSIFFFFDNDKCIFSHSIVRFLHNFSIPLGQRMQLSLINFLFDPLLLRLELRYQERG